MKGVCVILAALCAVAIAQPLLSDFLPDVQRDDAGKVRGPHCVTTEVWQWKKALRRLGGNPTSNTTCPKEGRCDDPTVRDSTSDAPITIPLVWHVITDSQGNYPDGVNEARVKEQMASLLTDYSSYGVNFVVDSIQFHRDNTFYCIPAYTNRNSNWYSAILNLKLKYATEPDKKMNVFVSCQKSGTMGTLLGMGTFPWDPEALEAEGGLWMNSLAVGGGQKTLNHEIGHNLGLWHTFHGVDEVNGCEDPCFEAPHNYDAKWADSVGDFCRDTPPTPVNYECRQPGGSDCEGVAWGTTLINNIMSYSPDSCMSSFTDMQSNRMHCWACDKYSSVFSGCPTPSA